MNIEQYQKAMQSIELTQVQKNRILTRVCTAKAPMVHLRRALLLGALCLLLCGAACASGLDAVGWLSRLLMPGDGMALLTEAADAPGQSVTCDGLRITLESAVSDRFGIYILLDVARSDGTALLQQDEARALDEANLTGVPPLYFGLEMQCLTGLSCTRVDDGEDPTRMQVALQINLSTQEPMDQPLTLSIDQIGYPVFHEGTLSAQPLAQGDWRFRVRPKPGTECRYALSESLTAYVTPISVALEGSNRGMVSDWQVELSDGRVLTCFGEGYSSAAHNGRVTYSLIMANLPEIIDPTQVVALLLDGQRLSLTAP